MIGLLLEVITQHTIIKQHLHIVSLAIANPFLARLLLDQQLHIVSHQVDTASQTQPFTDKGGLQERFIAVVDSKQIVHRFTDICYLTLCISLELCRLEAFTSAKLQSLLTERATQHIAKLGIGIVDNPIKCRTSKVTQQDRLRIGRRL